MMNTPANRQVLYLALLALVVSILVGINSIIYANNVGRATDRKWCEVIGTLDQAYTQHPPQTDAGKQFAVEIHALHARLGC